MTQLTIHPLQPGDLPAVRAMFERLSRRTIYLRFFSPGEGPVLAELAYLADLDGHERVALVAEACSQTVGLARFHRTGSGTAVAAVLVEDGWQQQGVGRRLMAELAVAARQEGLTALEVSVLGENQAALRLVRGMAPGVRFELDHGVVEAAIPLVATAA